MALRSYNIRNPGSGGLVTDLPAWRLNPDQSSEANDLVIHNGVAHARRGWTRWNTTQVVNDDIDGVWRVKHTLTDVTNTYVSLINTLLDTQIYYVPDDNSASVLLNPPGDEGNSMAATRQRLETSGSHRCAPRASYNDMVIFCVTGGATPIQFAGGIRDNTNSAGSSGTPNTDSTNLIEGPGTVDTNPPATGSFICTGFQTATNNNIKIHFQITASTDDATQWWYSVRGLSVGTAQLLVPGQWSEQALALSFPCVPIDDRGAITTSGNTATGYGTSFATDDPLAASDDNADGWYDALLILDVDGTIKLREIESVTDDDTLTFSGATYTTSAKSPYKILRRCPFRDVAVHRGSLFGCGVASDKSAVWVAPPGWDPQTPPDGLNTFDISGDVHADAQTDFNNYLLDRIPVPAIGDGDDVEAILSTPDGLLVLKRKSVHMIYGSYPNFTQEMIHGNAGCADLASAFSSQMGSFWAGHTGIFTYWGGRVVDLTEGKINEEWRSFMSTWTSIAAGNQVTAGEYDGHLLITATNATTRKSWLLEYNSNNPYESKWESELTNCDWQGLHSTSVPGEADSLLAVGTDDKGYVVDMGPALDGTGDEIDADAGIPALKYVGPAAHYPGGRITDEHRLVDVDVAWNGVDTSTPTTTMTVKAHYWSGKRTSGSSPITIGTAAATTTDEVELYEGKTGVSGRFHKLELASGTLDATNEEISLHEVSMTFHDNRQNA